MKYLVFFLFVLPAFACKMSPEVAMRRAEATALEAVKKETKSVNLMAKHVYPFWYVRTTKLGCVEYKVGVDNGKGDCKMKARILGHQPCK